MRRVRVEKPAAIGAQLLDDLLGSNRSLSDCLACLSLGRFFSGDGIGLCKLLRFYQRSLSVRFEVLNDALRHHCQGSDDAQRKQHIERTPGQINPEVADGLCLAARDAANKCDCQYYAGGCGHEVVESKPGHLYEVTHRRFAGVGLPVCVGSKADGSVKGEIGIHPAELLWIERQIILKALKRIEYEQPRNAKQKHSRGVSCPMLLRGWVYAACSIDQPFDRTHRSAHESLFTLKDPGHVDSERLGYHKQHEEVDCKLYESVECHLASPPWERSHPCLLVSARRPLQREQARMPALPGFKTSPV